MHWIVQPSRNPFQLMALRVLELLRLLEVDLHVWHFRMNALGIFDSPSAKGAICPLHVLSGQIYGLVNGAKLLIFWDYWKLNNLLSQVNQSGLSVSIFIIFLSFGCRIEIVLKPIPFVLFNNFISISCLLDNLVTIIRSPFQTKWSFLGAGLEFIMTPRKFFQQGAVHQRNFVKTISRYRISQ